MNWWAVGRWVVTGLVGLAFALFVYAALLGLDAVAASLRDLDERVGPDLSGTAQLKLVDWAEHLELPIRKARCSPASGSGRSPRLTRCSAVVGDELWTVDCDPKAGDCEVVSAVPIPPAF